MYIALLFSYFKNTKIYKLFRLYHLLEWHCKELLIRVDIMRMNLLLDGLSPSYLLIYLSKDLSQTLAVCKSKGPLQKKLGKP